MCRADHWQGETQQSLVQLGASVENLTWQGRSLPHEGVCGGQTERKEEMKPHGNRWELMEPLHSPPLCLLLTMLGFILPF